MSRQKTLSDKKLIIIVTLIASTLFIPFSWAAEAKDLFSRANGAYENHEFNQAIQDYRELLQRGIRHGAVYYNLGNAYWKSGQRGEAVLHYERAARLLPRDRDVKVNLSYARQEIALERKLHSPTGNFLERMAEGLTGKTALRELSLVTVTVYWISILFLFVWEAWISRRSLFKPWLVALGIAWIFLFGLTGLKIYDLNRPDAVIREKEVVLRGGPGEDYPAQATVPEGITVRILRHSRGWTEVRLGDLQGWISQEAVERI